MISSAAKIKSVRNNLPLSCLGFFSGKGSTVCTADCIFSFHTDARISHLKPQSYQVEHQWFGPAHLSPDHSPYVLDFLWGKKRVLCMTRRQTRNCKQGISKQKRKQVLILLPQVSLEMLLVEKIAFHKLLYEK